MCCVGLLSSRNGFHRFCILQSTNVCRLGTPQLAILENQYQMLFLIGLLPYAIVLYAIFIISIIGDYIVIHVIVVIVRYFVLVAS